MRARTLGLAVFVLWGCSSPGSTPDRPPVAKTAEPIVGGTLSTVAQDSVVFVQLANGAFCSGTLIAANLVLTARRCVAELDESTACGTFGADGAASSLSVAVGRLTVQSAPKIVAQGTKVIDDGNASGCSHDIALIQLDQDIAGAKIAKVRQTPAAKGDLVTALGFGDDGTGTLTDGRYQRTGIAILGVGATTFTYTQKTGTAIPVTVSAGEIGTGESTCYGDTGGPIFDSTGAIVGVASHGVGGSCIDSPAIFSDVASHYTMIAQAAAAAGHPLAPAGGDAGAGGKGDGGKGKHDGGDPGADDGSGDDPFGGDLSPGVPAEAGSGNAQGSDDFGAGRPQAACSAGARAPDASWFFVFGAVALAGARRRRNRA